MENPVQNKSIQTFAEDMAKTIEGNVDGGMIKKIIKEQEEKEAEKRLPESKKNQLFLYASLILLVIAGIIISLFFKFRNVISTVDIAPQFVPLIFTDKSQYKEISGLTKDQIAATLLNEKNTTELKREGIEGLYFTKIKKVVGFKDFIPTIEANLTPDQIKYIDNNFLIGIFNPNTEVEKKSLFILLKIRSLADVFPTMRSWERKMFNDLHQFFGVDLNPDTNYLLTKDWQDGIIQNKNARVLRDKDDNVVLMYVFVNDNSLVISDSEDTVKEVMLRLSSSQIQK
jgi:hypothetical protein